MVNKGIIAVLQARLVCGDIDYGESAWILRSETQDNVWNGLKGHIPCGERTFENRARVTSKV
jgi:hypothetical protein